MATSDDQANDPPLAADEQRRLATLRAALALGQANGPFRPFDFAAFLASRAYAAEP
jgi:hypothetical protein